MNIKEIIKSLLSIVGNRFTGVTPVDVSSDDISTQADGCALIHMTLGRSGLFVMLPYNLNISLHVSNYPPESFGFETRLNKFDQDKVYHLLGLLSSIPARNKDLIVEDGYIPLNASILNNYMTDYNSYLNYLIRTGVIERDREEEHVPDKSRRYRWTEQYINSEFIKVEMPRFRRMNERERTITLEKFITQKSKYQSYSERHLYLTHWYTTNKLNIDISQAENHALEVRNIKLAKGVESWDWNKDKNQSKHPSNQYMAILENMHSIAFNHDYKIQIDSHVHRLHSVLTNMQKEFRNFLTYDSQQLVSIDIKNSQPYLSCILFNPHFWEENSSLYLNINQLPENIINSIRLTPPRSGAISITSALNSFFRGLEEGEFDEYKEIVSSGNMYETIMKWVQQEKGQVIKRNDAKTTMFKLFFSPNRENSSDENHWLMAYYKNKFPKVAELFKIIKKRYLNLDERKQHGRLACLLQSIESEIILHKCCKRIWEEKKHEVPLFTIHDSIATTIEHQDYVKRVMEEILFQSIGIKPSLAIETWHTSNLYNITKLPVCI